MFNIPDTELVKLNDVSDPRSILFIVAGIEGNCNAFADLASRLGGAAPRVQVFGLEFSANVPEDSVERAAEFYEGVIGRAMSTQTHRLAAFSLAGYSFGGLIAIEICRRARLPVANLLLFETSHAFFRRSVHAIADTYGVCIPHADIFRDRRIYPGSLAIYLGFLIGQPNRAFRFGLYDQLQRERVAGLDDALQRAFDYVARHALYAFASRDELEQMKRYLRHMLVKSNAAFLYEFDVDEAKRKLRVPVCLLKSSNFLYKNCKALFYVDAESTRRPYEFDERDFNLSHIVEDAHERLQVFECQRGNHWTFIDENIDEIFDIVSGLLCKPCSSNRSRKRSNPSQQVLSALDLKSKL